MTVQELESVVTKLPRAELDLFAHWFEEYMADLWDRQIEGDIISGKLNDLGQQADIDFEAGSCTPL